MLTTFLSMALMATAPETAAAAAPLANPLAKAEAGFVQCYQPNQAAKTCQSIASYKRNGDGTWAQKTIVPLAPGQPVTLEALSSVRINETGTVCGQSRKDSAVKIDQSASSTLTYAEFQTNFARITDALIGKEICTTYLADGAGMIAKATIDGQPAPMPDQKVIWIKPEDGYTARLNP